MDPCNMYGRVPLLSAYHDIVNLLCPNTKQKVKNEKTEEASSLSL